MNGPPYVARMFGHHSTRLYEFDGHRVVALLGLEDRVIAHLHTFDKAFFSFRLCVSFCMSI